MATDTRIRVLIADDNRAVRRGLRLRLGAIADIVVIGEVADGRDAITVARAERADVVLMDIQMPGLSGIAATRALAAPETGDPVAVIVMTSFALDDVVAEALDAGAVGYLLKSHDLGEIVTAIRAASRGEGVVSRKVIRPVLQEFARRRLEPVLDPAVDLLTPAERRVVGALARGVTSNDGIAGHLHVSIHTVRSQLASALKKTGSADRTQLALWGVRNSLDAADAPLPGAGS